MQTKPSLHIAASITAVALIASGCGSSDNSSTNTQTDSSGVLSPESQSAATGDIPDNQNFLVFHNAHARYSIRYPEGWARHGTGNDVTFQDKNNLVQIVVRNGAAPTVASARTELAKLHSTDRSLQVGMAQAVTVKGKPAVKLTYTTQSKPNQVTNKRVTLTVDRYELANRGRIATIDLGTPKGVDNVDAYRLMTESFKWK